MPGLTTGERQLERRRFLGQMGTVIASRTLAGVVGSTLSCAAGRDGPVGRVSPGVQLYTIRDVMGDGVESALEVVAGIGYQEVEFAGYFGHSGDEIHSMLGDFGLRSPAAHISLGATRRNLTATIESARSAGHAYVIVPSLPGDLRTREGYFRLAEEFNEFGEVCRDSGMTFGYHNHDFEFEAFGDENGLDILLGNTDPELVAFELDFFWMSRAGADPTMYMTDHSGRFHLGHVKDMDASGAMVDVGAGTLDFASLLSVALEHGMKHFFVEHDRPDDSLESIRASYRHLVALNI